MKILLLTVGLALVCGLQADNNLPEDGSSLTGKWYTIALGSSVRSKIEEGGSLRVFIRKLSEYDGILTAEFYKKEDGICTPFSLSTFEGPNGENMAMYDGLNEFTLQELGSDHVMFTLVNTNDGEVTYWAELFGRTPNLSDEIKDKFMEVCEENGIQKDHIIDLSNDDRCEKLRQEHSS